MKDAADRIEAIFTAALEIESAQERQSFIEKMCPRDIELRRQVESLVANHFAAGGFLQTSAIAEKTLSPTLDYRAGDSIGPYTLLEKIGEGGFGLVFLAQQESPIRRQVALKAIKPGMDSRQVLARFETERQALSMMEHPNIARVLDGGVTEWGRPYLVMELVRGIPITQYCDDNRLSPRERLALFVPVCKAVQHAHQKGIIHRDLKPNNVLVSMPHGVPEPKVIDFGVAKALGQSLSPETLATGVGRIIGTLEYMSPEQAEWDAADIDTRADIYSLGVLLYELLTGTTPLNRNRLKHAALAELLRVVREEEPPPPSARLADSKETLANVSAQRKLEPSRLTQTIRGELDWIVMKCLEKDRNRRYETADGLVRDLERFLADEPVQAAPPALAYRVKKFVRRHRITLAAAAIILLSLIGGIVGTSIGLVDAQRQAKMARAAESREADARNHEQQRAEAEKQQRMRAEQTEALANGLVQFMTKDLLGLAGIKAQADRNLAPNPNLTVREVLDLAAQSVGDKFADQPELQATIRKTLGEMYLQLESPQAAIEQLTAAVQLREQQNGPKDNRTLAVRYSLAQALRAAGNPADAIELLASVSEDWKATLGPEAPETLNALGELATAYFDVGDRESARTISMRVRDARLKTLGFDNPATLVTLNNLATLDLSDGKIESAIVDLEQVYSAKLKVLGSEHPETLPALQNLAVAYWNNHQLDRSIPLFEKLVQTSIRVYGPDSAMTLGAMANLGVNYRDVQRFDEAIELLEKAFRARTHHPTLGFVASELLLAYERAGRTEKAVALTKNLLAESRTNYPADSISLASALALAGTRFLQFHSWVEAEAAWRECLAIRQRKQPEQWRTLNTEIYLGEALLGQGRYADAEPLLLEGHEGIQRLSEQEPARTKERLAESAEALARLYDAWNKPSDAAKWRSVVPPGR